MRTSEKTGGDILRSLDSLRGQGGTMKAESLCAVARRHFGFLPQASLDEIERIFVDKYEADPERAREWIVALSGIFLKEYDGSPLSASEWEEIRDIVSLGAEEMEMGLLSYAMSLVLEHKAL